MATIYFVDDDFASDLIVQNLRFRGHTVERFSTAENALLEAARIAASDLVVLDLIMPRSAEGLEGGADGARSNGMLVFTELRQRRANLPILVYTANQDASIIDIIEQDKHSRYLSRWSSPTLRDFISLVYQMLKNEIGEVPMRSFIVHGHDDKTKLEVKNYLQNRLRLSEPIILHEQPNLGRTLIEKFEDFAGSADLAFVLLTPDDRLAGAASGDDEKRRARQNVILELGFFLGMLGRSSGRVFLLYKGPLELPSDLNGVVYLNIDNGVDSVGENIRLELAAIKGIWSK